MSAHSCLQKARNLPDPFSASDSMTDSIVPCMPQGPAAVHTMVAATWLPCHTKLCISHCLAKRRDRLLERYFADTLQMHAFGQSMGPYTAGPSNAGDNDCVLCRSHETISRAPSPIVWQLMIALQA